ncbi:MAG: mechanosensitive ion channel [Planctomycetes bacterium]|nr:mechanosensitive ion channel [Planctomycetota bacterium]
MYQFARGLANAPKFLDRWLFTQSTSPWFKIFRENKVFTRMAQFAPALFIFFAAAVVFPAPGLTQDDPFPYLNTFQNCYILLSRFGLAYVAFIFMLVALAIADSFDEIYTAGQPDDNPIKGIVRATKRLIALVGVVLICAALAGRNPMYFVGGLGAFMAVIMLVFKDSILGLVASIQIIANNMVKIGDWIEMPKYGADGDVIEISLSTVKVQNFDKTISTIPTYALLSESFRNWSGMENAGGRRIKRAVFIDMHSIKVCTPEMIARFEKIELIGDYIQQKKRDLKQYNDEHEVMASLVNSRRLTNIGTFRAYLEAYLSSHPKLRACETITRLLTTFRFGLFHSGMMDFSGCCFFGVHPSSHRPIWGFVGFRNG